MDNITHTEIDPDYIITAASTSMEAEDDEIDYLADITEKINSLEQKIDFLIDEVKEIHSILDGQRGSK